LSAISRLEDGQNGQRSDSVDTLERICIWLAVEAQRQGRDDLDTTLWGLCPDVFRRRGGEPDSGTAGEQESKTAGEQEKPEEVAA
jgi:hypothetical protein